MSGLVEETGHERLRIIAMNRPQRRNALDAALCQGLLEAAQRAARDTAVTAVLLRGSGGYFCVGGDVKAMADGPARSGTVEQRTAELRGRMEVSRVLHTMPKPTIAAIDGAAAGAGLSLALACDFRIAARSAKLTTAFANVGLSGDFGGSWFLSHIVGTARARELYLTPCTLTADEAQAIGLVTRVVADDDLHESAQRFALELANGPGLALEYMKHNLNHAMTGGLDAALDLEAAHHVRSSLTEDHREAAAAFVAKRSPVFRSR